MGAFENRIQRLAERIERVRIFQTMEPDPLSAALYEFSDELAALDERGINALADELYITPEDVRRMIRDYTT